MADQSTPTREQMIGFVQRSSDDAWLNSNTHTAQMFEAIANALRQESSRLRALEELSAAWRAEAVGLRKGQGWVARTMIGCADELDALLTPPPATKGPA